MTKETKSIQNVYYVVLNVCANGCYICLVYCFVCALMKTCFRVHNFSHDDNRFWKVCEGLEIFLSFKTPRCLGSPSLLFRGYQRSLPAVDLLENEVTYSSESSAEVKNELSYASSLPCVP
jgi:hypothetical protein